MNHEKNCESRWRRFDSALFGAVGALGEVWLLLPDAVGDCCDVAALFFSSPNHLLSQ
jgi:hypothetical protein